MEKARSWLMCLIAAFMVVTLTSGCASLLTFFGLSAASKDSSSTTTSTSGGSTTTVTFVPGENSISGAVSGIQFGSLYVLAFVNNAYTGNPATYETIYVATGETSRNYSLSGLGNGTYYVVSVLNLNKWVQSFGSPEVGSKVGQYSNGYVPASFGQTPSGDPAAITISGSSATGKDFSLGVTWK